MTWERKRLHEMNWTASLRTMLLNEICGVTSRPFMVLTKMMGGVMKMEYA